jgi:hypothetical protein
VCSSSDCVNVDYSVVIQLTYDLVNDSRDREDILLLSIAANYDVVGRLGFDLRL